MNGIFSGLNAGIAANRAYGLEQARLGMDRQRLSLEQQRSDLERQQLERANTRLDLQDQLSASGQEIQNLDNAARTDKALVASAPQPPTGIRPADPQLAAQYDQQKAAFDTWKNSDHYQGYQDATERLAKTTDQLRELGGRHAAILGKVAGDYTAEVNDKLGRTEFNLTHNPDLVSGRDRADYLTGKYHLPPETFLKDPNTGIAPADQAAHAIMQGVETGQWDGKEGALSMLMPELHLAIGQQLPNGNTVTGTQATHMFFDPKDPGYVHVSQAIQHDGPAGPGAVQGPHMDDNGLRIPISTLMDRAKGFLGGVQMMQNPKAQAAVGDAVSRGDTALHEYLRVAGAAGAPPMAHEYKELPRGGSLVDVTPGASPTVIAKGQQFDTSFDRRNAAAQALVDSGAAGTIADAFAMLKGDSEAKDPNRKPTGDGGAAGPKPAAVQKKQTQALNDAETRLAGEKGWKKRSGQWLDKDGNAVADDELDLMRDAAAKAVDAGKPVAAADLIKTVKAARAIPQQLPSSKDKLTAGRVYTTARGNATWDGSKFVPVAK